MNTPIKVSHALQIELYFSIYGQDPRGQPMKYAGPGGSRMLKINRAVVVPSVSIVSSPSCGRSRLMISAFWYTTSSTSLLTKKAVKQPFQTNKSTSPVQYAGPAPPTGSVQPVLQDTDSPLIRDMIMIRKLSAIQVDGVGCVLRDSFLLGRDGDIVLVGCRLSRWKNVCRGW